MIVLADSNGIIVDHVSYQPTLPWPVIQQANECISLISSDLDNHFGSSWMLDNTVSITSVDVDSNLKIYPIPASDNLYISADVVISSVHIYDLTGRLLINEQPESKSFKLDVRFLTPGLYITEVNGNQTAKFVKR